MNSLIIATVTVGDVLLEMGIDEDKAEKILEKMSEFLEDEEGLPEDVEGFVTYIEDEELLKSALKKAKVDWTKFKAVLDTVSTEVPVYVTL